MGYKIRVKNMKWFKKKKVYEDNKKKEINVEELALNVFRIYYEDLLKKEQTAELKDFLDFEKKRIFLHYKLNWNMIPKETKQDLINRYLIQKKGSKQEFLNEFKGNFLCYGLR